MKSIKRKLILSFSILILAVTMIIGFVSLGIGYSQIKMEAESSLIQLAAEGAKLTESRMETLIATLNMVAMENEIKDIEWEVNLSILKEELEKTDFLDIGYVLPNGYTYYTDETVSLQSDRVYVQKALEGQANISDVVISRVTHKPEITVAVPVIKDGVVVGALVGRKESDALSNIIMDAGYGEKGYAYMINGSGTTIAHPDLTKVIDRYNPIEESEKNPAQDSDSEAFSKIIQDKNGITNYKNGESNIFAGYSQINGTDWIYVITADEAEVMKMLPKLVKSILTIMIIVLILSLGLVYLLDNSITKPVIKMAKRSDRIANLDITENIAEAYLNQKDEVGILARAFQKLTVNLREIMKEITDSANSVAATAQELTATSQQSANVTDEITRTVEEIAKGATEQANSTEEGSEHATKLGQIIEINYGHMSNLNAASGKVTEVVNDGIKEIERLSIIAMENEKATKEICDIILETKKSSGEIGEASKVIAFMAEQTNLLSLNASIEAARAGDAGRGFAVVAEEIKKMADQSAESTKLIDTIISGLQRNVKRAVDSMEKITVTSKEQKKSVAETIHKYQSIADAMKKSEVAIVEVNSSVKEMDTAKNEILILLQSLSALAEQNAAGTQQASSAMEEQAASVQEIASASDKLSGLASDLQAVVMRFKA